MTRLNSDVRMRMTGSDETGSMFASFNRRLQDSERQVRRWGIGIQRSLRLGGIGLAAAGVSRAMAGAPEAAVRLGFDEQTIQNIHRAQGALDRVFDEMKGFVGWLASQAVELHDQLTVGPRGVPQFPKNPLVALRKKSFAQSWMFPKLREEAGFLDQASGMLRGLPKPGQEGFNAAITQMVTEGVAKAAIRVKELERQQFAGVGLRRLPGLFGDIGRNMLGGLQTNLRGLGIFGGGVGRSIDDLVAQFQGNRAAAARRPTPTGYNAPPGLLAQEGRFRTIGTTNDPVIKKLDEGNKKQDRTNTLIGGLPKAIGDAVGKAFWAQLRIGEI